MSKKTKSSLTGTILASSFLGCLYLAGCSDNRELLETPLEQSYFLPNPPIRVWKAVLVEASKPTRRILVDDEATRLLSWIGEVEADDRLHASLSDPDASEEGTVAITVIWAEDAPGGTKLTIRETYFSGRPFVGVSPSRGNYEQEILRSIRTLVTLENTSHAKAQR